MNLYAFWWRSVLQSWWFHYKVTVIIVSATHHKVVHYQYAQSCHPAFQPNSICWQKQPYYHYRPRLKRCQLSKALLRARLGSKLKICLNGIKMHIFFWKSCSLKIYHNLFFKEILYYNRHRANSINFCNVAKSFPNFVVCFYHYITILIKATFDDPSVITVNICHHIS